MLCSETIQRKPQRGAAEGRPPLWRRPKAASFALALNKAHVLALNTAHVLRLNKADVLALNKAHVLRLNSKILCFSTTPKFAGNLPVKRKATHINPEAPGASKVTKLERGGHFVQRNLINASIWSKLFFRLKFDSLETKMPYIFPPIFPRKSFHIKDTWKFSSRKLRRAICYTLYRMDPRKTHWRQRFYTKMSKIKTNRKCIYIYMFPYFPY